MHVAIDGRLLSYTEGGISQYTRQIARELVALPHLERITLLHSARRGAPRLDARGLQLRGLFTPPHHRWEQLALPLELYALRPDVIHSPDFIPPFHGPWKRVITVHDLGFHFFPETVTAESARYYGQVRRAVHEADAVIAVSACTARDVVTHLEGDQSRIFTIPNGVDPDLHQVTDPATLGSWRKRNGIDRPFVLFGGTFEPRKNIPLLLKAFARVRETRDVLLVLLGARGWLYQPILHTIETLGIDASVRIIEGAPRSDWATAYSSAEALVIPSIYEGFGLPALEAMACGTAVITSDAAALPEVVGDAGIIFPSGDEDALTRALDDVLGDPELQSRLVEAGRERVKAFSWAKSAAATLEVYRSVAPA